MARVVRLTVAGTPADTDTVTYTIGGVAVTYTLGPADDEESAAAGLYALLAASTDPKFAEVTWGYTAGDAFVTGTARSPGVPFAGTASDSGTTTLTETVPAANSGPNDVSLTANWSAGTLPSATDDVLIDGGPDLLYGWESVSAAAYNSLKVKAAFAGKIGLPFRNEAGGYAEYRTRRWAVDTGVPVTIGEGDGQGPARVNLGLGSAAAVTVIRTQPRRGDSEPVVNLSGCSSGTVDVVGGDVGLAADDSTLAATVTTGTVGAGATLTVGAGATVTTLNQRGGAVTNYGTVGTANGSEGAFTHYGTIGTAVVGDPGFVFDWRAGGTITTATFRGQANATQPKLDCSNDPRAKTITTGTFTGGAILYDPAKTATVSGQTWDRASLAASDLGDRFTLTRT